MSTVESLENRQSQEWFAKMYRRQLQLRDQQTIAYTRNIFITYCIRLLQERWTPRNPSIIAKIEENGPINASNKKQFDGYKNTIGYTIIAPFFTPRNQRPPLGVMLMETCFTVSTPLASSAQSDKQDTTTAVGEKKHRDREFSRGGLIKRARYIPDDYERCLHLRASRNV